METRLQQLIQELEDLLEEETESSDHPWITRTLLEQLFHQEYGSALENILQDYGYLDLKTFLRTSNIFAIYETPIPHKFYIALLRKTVPGYRQSSSRNQSMFYTVKRPWKVDRCLIKDLQNEGYLPTDTSKQKNISDRSNYPDQIISKYDFKRALIEIVKAKKTVDFDELNRDFYKIYNQSIRGFRLKLFPDIKLIDILQTIPELKLEKIQNTLQITLWGH
jgi:OST-HTH/LOTUS domain